ncbi:iron-containing alcohol dehydrogenase [Salirhabdus sp. Marseille-P4669]|uniref:iron-containing alcohol dehydrogenase n=1 Tax=Salirhabdus sp. Marseille-P4669 TaxID=2042310 RepID=UPI000C7A76EF|nr:iron-containing alcohol dehydrogenase [Salirhabdus sp. Marseille-P4669]
MNPFVSPQTLITGEGVLTEVVEQIRKFGASKAMIYADPGVVKAGLVTRLEHTLQLGEIDYELFTDVVPEPPLNIANHAVQVLRKSNADIIIGIGGGSTLDIAKACAVLSSHEGKVEDYLNLTGTKKLVHKGLPKILIPTTAGTGSEVTDIAVFSLDTTKDVITDPYLLADTAIVDYELTYSLPPRITASTGVDALTHAIEAYTSIRASELTDTLALDAIKRIGKNIRTAVWNGSDNEARKQMALGSLQAGLSFYNAGVAGVHALAYPLGGLFKIPHGESNAVLLPYVFEYIWPSCLGKMGNVAEALGLKVDHLSDREAAIKAVEELYNIVKDVGIPTTIKEFGIKESDIEQLTRDAVKQTRLLARSPKAYTEKDIRAVYGKAFEGKLKLN